MNEPELDLGDRGEGRPPRPAAVPSEEQEAPRFEEALERLEDVVAQMESGSLSLDESMKHFEEGMKLAGFWSERLAETEKKVEILLKKSDADVEWGPLPTRSPGEEEV